MKRNKLVAIFMVAIMAISVGGAAFAGSAAAQSDTAVQTYDDLLHINVDTDAENVSVALTENVDLTAGETVTYQTDAYAASAEVVNSSGAGEVEVSINSNGEVEVTETTGSDPVTIEELQVTFDTAQFPYVTDSATPVDENYTGDASLTFADQQSDGERLTLSAANENEFFVVVHEVNNGTTITENYVGASDELSGDYDTVNVDLDENLENDTNLTAKLYTSNDGEIGEAIDGIASTAQVAVDDVVMSDYTNLVDGPGTETVQWMAYHADKVVDSTIEADNGEVNGSTYEPNETGKDVQFTVDMTRNGTPYEDLDLSDLHLSFGFDKNVFNDIEDKTELDSDTLTLKEINEEDSQKEYVYDVVESNNVSATYTLELTGEVTAANSDDAITVGSIQTPNNGPTSEHQNAYEINEGGDGAMFSGAFGIDDVGTLTAAVLSTVSVGLVGYVGYTKNVIGRIRNRDFSAEVFGIGAATVVVIVGAAEALSGTGIALTPAFDMVGYQAEQWVLGLVALAVAGLAAATTLDEDELPRR